MSQWTATPVRRAAAYSVVAVGLVAAWMALLTAGWQIKSTTHTLVETVAAWIALFAGATATLHYYTRRDTRCLFLGIGLIGAACLDGFHALVTADSMAEHMRSDLDTLSPWSWFVSRFFLATSFLAGWIASRRTARLMLQRRAITPLWLGCGCVWIAAIIWLVVSRLPQAYTPGQTFPRPMEFASAGVFALALTGYLWRLRWQADQLESWLVVALIISVCTDALYMPRSAGMFDAMFSVAHFLKVLSYTALAVAVLVEVYQSLQRIARESDQLTHETAQRQDAEKHLDEERRNLRLALDAVKGGMWWWDVASGKIQWDQRMHELFGLKAGRFGGTEEDWIALLHTDDAERAKRRRLQALAGKRPYEDTYRTLHSTGELRFIHDRGLVLRDSNGEAIRMVGHCVDVTDTIRATQELTESEARFRSMADHAPVLIWMADKNKKLTYFNRQWLDFTGRSQREERGEGWALGVHPDDRQACMDAYDSAFTARQPFQMEYRLRRHDGAYCWMLATGAPRFTNDKDFLGYVGSCVNISDLNEVMQSLRITQFAVDRAPDAVFWVRPDGRFVYVNDQACRSLQYSASELLALYVSDVDVSIPADQWPAFWERIKNETVLQFDTRIRRKDRSEFPAELTIGLLETATGELACAFARDVTERRREQNALRASEERFDLAIRGTGEGIWEWEVGADRVWYAPRFAEMLGYPANEWPHTLQSFNDHLHPDDHERTWAAVNSHLESGGPYDVEYRLRTKEGEYRWFRARGTSSRDAAGVATRMAGSIQDIQDRKNAQFALERFNEELRRIADIASHGLQEPLQVLTDLCLLLDHDYRDQLDAAANARIDQAVLASDRLQELVGDLLTYSRIEPDAQSTESESGTA